MIDFVQYILGEVKEKRLQKKDAIELIYSFQNQIVTQKSHFLHPLLHQNTSNLLEQRFSSIFTGQEFFLADHIVKGQHVLPGVAYLEMAQAAVQQAAGASFEEIRLKNVVWSQPIVVMNDSFEVNIRIFPEENGDLSFEIYSEIDKDDGQPVVHSQGRVVLESSQETPKLEINALLGECSPQFLSFSKCYEMFRKIGLDYGPGHQTVEKVHIGDEYVLAKITLPASFSTTLDQFVIHPGLMDGALQAAIGLGMSDIEKTISDPVASLKTYLPFAMEKLKIYSRCVSDMWALIRYSHGSKSGDKVQKLDIDLCDAQGKVCIEIKGYSSRVLEGEVGTVSEKSFTMDETLLQMQKEDASRKDGFDEIGLKESIKKALIQTVSQLLKVKAEDIDADATWEEMGLDQFVLAEFANNLNVEYKVLLNIADFSQYESLNRFIDYLIEKYCDAFKEYFHTPELKVETRKDVSADNITDDLLKDKTINYLKKQVSNIIKLPADRIKADSSMEKYGIDSIVSMQLVNQLEKDFGSLPKTLFFEYQNIDELSDYFIESYKEQLVKLLGIVEKKVQKVKAEVKKEALKLAEHLISAQSHIGQRFAPVRNKSGHERMTDGFDVAVIGVSGCYPQARNLQEFWENLSNGRDCITEIPKDRWDHSIYFDEDKNKPGKVYSKWGGFIEDVDKFDPLFFNISPKEAEIMDPQERLFLQCVYGTLEDAGYTREELNRNIGGNVGVFVGVMYEEYQLYGVQETLMRNPLALSGNPSSIANRVSYFCNFHGPSMAIDTMCSSSLTSIHIACQSLVQGGCELAVAGGVNVSIHPNKYIMLSQGKFVSSKGRCESFGLGGDGYVPGEGVGAVLLKPLHKAIQDKDNIYGVIKGSALNHGGKTNGYTVPNPNAQAELVGKAFISAGINPRTVSYIEAHGTGTSLGDPIEIAGLNRAFEKYTKEKQFCAIGSAKSNIGHCESAAGIAGVTKVLLQMKYSKLVPSLHSDILNPYIDFDKSPFWVQQELADWKRPVIEIDGEVKEYPRIAGVSAFGAGGANAHVVIEEYVSSFEQRTKTNLPDDIPVVIVLSAKNEDRLKARIRQLLKVVKDGQFDDSELIDVAFTLQVGREHMEERLAVLVESFDELVDRLHAFLEGKEGINGMYRGQTKRNKEALAVILEDEDLQNAINTWVDKGKIEKLVDLWAQGLNFDWKRLYGNFQPSRVSLPTYPFEGERYWAPEAKAPINIGATAIHRKDVDFSDMHKKIYIRVKSYSNKNTESSIKIEESKETFGAMLLEPYWKEKVVNNAQVSYTKHMVVLCEIDHITKENIEGCMDGVECISLQHNESRIEKRFQVYVEKIFEEIQRVFKSKPKGRVLMQIVAVSQKDKQIFAGLSGLLKTSSIENPKLIGQLIELDSIEGLDFVVEKLKDNSKNPEDIRINYISGKRHVEALRECENSGDINIPWKNNGVYLITGGAGGLGLIFAREIAKGAQNTILILTGRSKLSHDKENKLKELESIGAKVIYQQVDVTDKEEISALIKSTVEEFGGIDGIIHSAGVIRDNYIIKKTNEEFMEVLRPKVSGLVYLDEATCDLNLDFFILFSSIAGSLGNAGQVDYSTGNTFMDAYAKYRNSLVSAKERHGYTLSINWPLWKNGGMQINEAIENEMRKKTGMIALQTSTGIKALYEGLATENGHVLVLEGEIPKIREILFGIKEEPKLQDTSVDDAVDKDILKEKIIIKFKEMFSEVSKMDIGRIDIEEPLESYGIDSIMITQLNENLTLCFEDLSKTIFYEYQTLGALGEYLIGNYTKECIKWVGLEQGLQAIENLPSKPIQNADNYTKLLSLRKRKAIRSFEGSDKEADMHEPIAIIGISGRFPGAQNIKEYWENLKLGKDCITEIPKDRWDIEGFYNPDSKEAMANGKSYSKWGGFVDGFADFDPLFFNISPRETINIDPQERLFIESCWEVLEDAGYTREQLASQYKGKVGVFAGITKTGYDLYGPSLWRQGEDVCPYTSFGSVANRVSYLFNLHGPSMPIDTMCSSSLTAIHEACEHIQHGECQMAIAGGVNLYLHPSSYVALCAQQMLSKDGSCKSFGKGGNGFVPGEGVGTVLLKTLSKAQKDGDHIYGVIRGTGINHDGKTNGYTVPNPIAQGELIREVMDKAGVNARQISYIEAHGTGTELGDPIEITGLTNAFGKDTKDSEYCTIGSAKSNIGHLEAAAGIAGVLKVVLQMKHKKLVPSLHAKELNPNINFGKTPFVVPQELTEWKSPEVDVNGETVTYPRIAGISAFGAGGVNAHVVIEEYTDDIRTRMNVAAGSNLGCIASSGVKRNDQLGRVVIVLSAKNEESLKILANRLVAAIMDEQYTEDDLPNIAYTLQVGREGMDERLAMLVSSIKELVEKLDEFVQGKLMISDLYRGNAKRGKSTSNIETDEDMAKTIDAWIQKGKYGKVINLWVDGLAFDWNRLYDDVKPCRISLPTYPFAREKYWVADLCNEKEIAYQSYKDLKSEDIAEDPDNYDMQSTNDFDLEEALEMMTFEEVWDKQPLVNTQSVPIKTLVCFLTNSENQKSFASFVKAFDKNIKLIFISQGTSYKVLQSKKNYSLDKADKDQYTRVFENILEHHGEVDTVLNLWPLEETDYMNVYSNIVYIIKALKDSKLKSKNLIIAAQFQNGLERCYFESWIGFERSLGLLMPGMNVRAVCKEIDHNKKLDMEKWTEILLHELQASKAQSVLYMNDNRYVSNIRQTQLTKGISVLKNRATYLITGGCGGLGFLFAEHLAKAHFVNLVLTGRSELNEEKKSKIKALEQMGSKVLYIEADVCDINAMKEGLKLAKEHFGGIQGIIHAAGIASSTSIFEKEIQSFNKVLESKVTGTIVLDELLKDEKLDFICYFSSSSAVLGDFGSCDYSIANRFQMAYAQYRNEKLLRGETSGKAFVINWPLWKDGGMGFDSDDGTKMYLKSSGQRFLEAQEGIEIFDRILSQDKNMQNLVFVGQHSRIQKFLRISEEQPLISLTSCNLGKGRRPEMRGLGVEQCIEWDLKELVSEILKISRDKLDMDTVLADFGFDSISLAEFADVLTNHFGIEITPALFYGYSTLEKLVEYYNSKYKEEVNEFYREEAISKPVFKRDMNIKAAIRHDKPLKSKVYKNEADTMEPIAIIGMSGRFPQARDVNEMWEVLAKGQEMVKEIPEERFDWRKYYGGSSIEPGKINCKWCGTVPGVSEFDAMFFEISPKEAETMDPRQRLLLQEAWNALEDAGYGAFQIKEDKIGMFVGVEEGDYHLISNGEGSITSNNNAVLSARLSYFLNLTGPNIAINTACSSGLVATHLACQSLRNNECSTAIVAGVSLLLSAQSYIGMSQAGMLSPDGKTYSFDKRANGMVPGEAVAALVLKPLSKAKEDGDPIYAVIKGSGINYDGKTNGITAPSGVSQKELLKSVYDQYKINPEDIEYIVTHGTGTKLGDPIEINALYDAFKDYTNKQGYCAITSNKTNFGHALSASGLVSLVNLIQAFKYEMIPASINCQQENEYINWKESPFYVNKTTKPWSCNDGKAHKGAVSAFGMSGTNAHVVLESYTAKDSAYKGVDPYYMLVFSAKSSEALHERIQDMIILLESKELDRKDLCQISYTLLQGRQHFKYRCAVVIRDTQDALYVLKQVGSREKISNLFQGKVQRDFREQDMLKRYIQDLLKECDVLKDSDTEYRELLCGFADLYCQGYEIDWNKLYGDVKLQRVHLPTYPFAKDHYWISKTKKQAEIKVRDARKDENFEKLLDEVLNDSISIDDFASDIENL